ncbi:MAG: cysteine desulfurase-like protein [Candidatus Eisenbacteria bacterium]
MSAQPFAPEQLAGLRSRFPALATPWALFDNAGGSVPLGGVIDRVADYMRRYGVQLGASYEPSQQAGALVAAGHRAAETLMGAEPGEVFLGASTTANIRLLARALRPLWNAGDEVVVTNLDHEANISPWRWLEREGLVVREWRLRPDTHALHADDLEPLLNARTRLVAFTHCANLVGTIHDAAAIVQRVHAAGALACIDGVAFAPHRLVDVKAIGADFYAVSLYKLYGPHIGMLYGRRDLLERARGQYHFFHDESEVPYKLEPGGVVHELAAALPGIVEYLLELDSALAGAAAAAPERDRLGRALDAIAQHESALVAPLLAFLHGRRGVRVLGEPTPDPARRVPTVAFTVAGHRASEFPPLLDAKQVAVRFGHFYAQRAIDALGLLAQDGVVRVSMAHYNTPAEVSRLIAALDETLPG